MEPNKRQRQGNWQGGRRGQDPQSTEQPGLKTGVRVPEGAVKGPKPQPKSPAKAQAHMLRTSRRSSDSDEELMYERAYLVRPQEDVKAKPMGEEVHQDLDQDEDPPFDMSQIKTSGMEEEPDRERVCFVRARLESEKEATKSGQSTSEPVQPEIVTDELCNRRAKCFGDCGEDSEEEGQTCQACYGNFGCRRLSCRNVRETSGK